MKALIAVFLYSLFLFAPCAFAKSLGEEVHEIIVQLDQLDNFKSSWWGTGRDWSEQNFKIKILNARLKEIEEQLKKSPRPKNFGEELLVVDHYNQINGSLSRSHNLYTHGTVVAELDGAKLVSLSQGADRLRVTSSEHVYDLKKFEVGESDTGKTFYYASAQLGGDKFWVQPTHILPNDYDSGVHDADIMVVYRAGDHSDIAFVNSKTNIFSPVSDLVSRKVILSINGFWILGEVLNQMVSTNSKMIALVISIPSGKKIVRVIDTQTEHAYWSQSAITAEKSKEVFLVNEEFEEGNQVYWPTFEQRYHSFHFLGSRFLGAINEGIVQSLRAATFESSRVKAVLKSTSLAKPANFYLVDSGLVIPAEITKAALGNKERAVSATVNACEKVFNLIKDLPI